MTTAAASPDNPSSDYLAMKPYWTMVEAILQGAQAMRDAGAAYLPEFPGEDDKDYAYRLANAKFTNLFADIVSNLASKPFAEKVALDESAPEDIAGFAEDIDGRGNHIHVFAAETFFAGICNAIDWILVDYTTVQPGATLAQERAAGARPYWVRVPANRMLAVYTATIEGREEIVHARMKEDLVERDGFKETTVERVRIFNREELLDEAGNAVGWGPATFQVLRRKTGTRRTASSWEIEAQGELTIGVIPLVPFITGRRIGAGWRFIPPMQDAANLQIEHYQQETKLKCAMDRTAFPLLAAEGVEPDRDGAGDPKPIRIGPGAVVYAPPYGDNGNHGEWNWKEPDAGSLKFLAEQINVCEQQMRELGRQPLTAQQGITVVSAAYAGQKASNAVQAWAWALKDALEQALVLTARWLNRTEQPTVSIFTDFALEIGEDKGPDVLTKARATGDISQETFWSELKRRNILSADFDPEEERQRLEDEMPDPDAEADMIAAAGGRPDPVVA